MSARLQQEVKSGEIIRQVQLPKFNAMMAASIQENNLYQRAMNLKRQQEVQRSSLPRHPRQTTGYRRMAAEAWHIQQIFVRLYIIQLSFSSNK